MAEVLATLLPPIIQVVENVSPEFMDLLGKFSGKMLQVTVPFSDM